MQRFPFAASALLSVCLTGSAQVATAQFLSPGDLARAHGDLEGDDECTSCHTAGRRIDEALCTECHTDIRRQRAANEGLHGEKYRGQPCEKCHVEHLGKGHDLIRWPGGSERRFTHEDTGFGLRMAHAEAACRDCHDKRNERGASTFLGLDPRCGSCHEDPHDRRLGDRCQDCHNERNFNQVEQDKLDHDKTRFPLRGKHKRVECADCHGAPPEYWGLRFETCGDCHEDPHVGRLGEVCSKCHSEADWKKLKMLRKDHPGLSLAAGHAPAECRECHDQGLLQAPSTGARCVGCHEPVHEARFGRECERCHASIRFLGLPDRVGRRAHPLTAFPLKGEHGKVACNDCHDPQIGQELRYRQLDYERCRDCHEDPHKREFEKWLQGECAPCHSESGFRPTLFGVEHHADTTFPLIGAHVAVACEACHGDADPRLSFVVQEQACADCHENPHGDQFRDEMALGGCGHCHSPLGFDQPLVDHSIWPLTGVHAQTDCDSCHQPTEEDRRRGKGLSYRGVPRVCEGCHEDEHAGQFRLRGEATSCGKCHNTQQFSLPNFDHAAVVGYPLEGQHAKLECGECHPTATLRGGQDVVTYRLGFRDCRDCHADPHAEAAR